MSIIVPSGKHSLNWVPSDEKLTKLAQAESGEEYVENDGREALYNAAKEVVEAMDADGDDDEGNGEDSGSDFGGEVSDDLGGEVTDDLGGEVSDKDKVEEAVEKVDEAVEELKSAVGVGDGENGDDVAVEDVSTEEVEIPVNEEEGELIVESVPAEVEGCGMMAGAEDGEAKDGEVQEETTEASTEEAKETVESSTEEAVVEAASKCDKCDKDKSCKCKDGEDCGCDLCACSYASDEAGMDKEASSDGDDFIKMAKLTPQNRKKVADYWKNALGYPADYVNLMVKDYEK